MKHPIETITIVPLTGSPKPPRAGKVREARFRTNAWLPAETDTLRSMAGQGAGVAAIAAALGRPVAGVADKACDIGIHWSTARPWSSLDDAELFRHYHRIPTHELAKHLDRAPTAIYSRAGLLGLANGSAPPYGAAEDAILRDLFPTATAIAEIATRLGRTGSSVLTRAYNLGLKRPDGPKQWTTDEQARALELAEAGHPYPRVRTMLATEGYPIRAESTFQAFIRRTGYARGWGRPWIDEEIDLIRAAYRDGANLVQLGHRMGRSGHSIRWKAAELGLQGSHPKPNGARQGRPWSEADDAVLRAKYGKGRMKTAKLAALLDRPKGAVYNRAFMLGLDHGYFREWTPEEDLIVRVAHEHGISLTDVASVLDRDQALVSKRSIGLGIPFSARPVKAPRGPRAKRQPVTRASLLALIRARQPEPD